MTGVRSAFDLAETNAQSVILLGAAATHPEIEYGWIEPGASVTNVSGDGLRPVERFWEKPSYQMAQSLLDRGCLWNTFVMVGGAAAFLAIIRDASPTLYSTFEPMLSLPDSAMEIEMMQRIYDRLPPADFSKQVLAVSTEKLVVANLDDIGWSDLGDPRRLVKTLHENGIENPWVAAGNFQSP